MRAEADGDAGGDCLPVFLRATDVFASTDPTGPDADDVNDEAENKVEGDAKALEADPNPNENVGLLVPENRPVPARGDTEEKLGNTKPPEEIEGGKAAEANDEADDATTGGAEEEGEKKVAGDAKALEAGANAAVLPAAVVASAAVAASAAVVASAAA